MTVEEMLDQMQVRQVLERHSRGPDRGDRDLIRGAYWPEAEIDYGPWKGAGREVAAVQQFAGTMHTLLQSNIAVNGATACTDTYFVAYHRLEEGGSVSRSTAYGRYVDRLQKIGEEWRIARRIVVMEHLQNEANIDSGGLSMDMFRRGRRFDRADVSYEGR